MDQPLNKFHAFLCNLEVHYHSINKPSPDHFVSQVNQVHEPTTYFLTFRFSIILLSIRGSPRTVPQFNRQTKLCYAFFIAVMHVT